VRSILLGGINIIAETRSAIGVRIGTINAKKINTKSTAPEIKGLLSPNR
jgi:hypothetical protein